MKLEKKLKKGLMITTMALENDDSKKYRLNPNYSVGEFVFDTDIKKYLGNKEFNINLSEDSTIGTMYQFIEPIVSVSIDERNIIESVTCEYKCYLYSINIINLNIQYVIKEIIKREPNLIESLWIIYKNKEVKEKVYDFDELGLQIWTYRNKVVTVICSNLDDTTGPAGSRSVGI